MQYHPIAIKLSDLFKTIDATFTDQTIDFKTGKTELQISTATAMSASWSINEIKENFNYSLRQEYIDATLFMYAPNTTLHEFKKKMMPYLRENFIYINEHYDMMHNVEQTRLGWYSADVSFPEIVIPEINERLKKQFLSDPNKFFKYFPKNSEVTQQNLIDGQYFPPVVTGNIHLKWTDNKSKIWMTRATGLNCSIKYRYFLKAILADIETTKNGRITFMDTSLQYGSNAMKNENAKAVEQQWHFLNEHEKHTVLNLSRSEMDTLRTDLEKLNGVISLHEHPDTTKKGTWLILTKNITNDELTKIDKYLSDHKQQLTPRSSPRRVSNDNDQMNSIFAEAWKKQNATKEITSNTNNAWATPLIPIKKISDDKSVTTTTTVDSQEEKIENLTNEVKNLVLIIENMKEENNALKAKVSKLEADSKKDNQTETKTSAVTQSNFTKLETCFEEMNKKVEDRLTTIASATTEYSKITTERFNTINKKLEGQYEHVNKKLDIQSKIYETKIANLHEICYEQSGKIIDYKENIDGMIGDAISISLARELGDLYCPLGSDKKKKNRK